VVEGARLESVCRGNPTEGSNPSLSANFASLRLALASGLQATARLSPRLGSNPSASEAAFASLGSPPSTDLEFRSLSPAVRTAKGRWDEAFRKPVSRLLKSFRPSPTRRAAGLPVGSAPLRSPAVLTPTPETCASKTRPRYAQIRGRRIHDRAWWRCLPSLIELAAPLTSMGRRSSRPRRPTCPEPL
jgi:hypothetical protein